ncbi:hypothetical protein IWW50_003687 [Coemansia erecta]|nr:hypothetical protein IWW50_003687 [Coemansia erecta]
MPASASKLSACILTRIFEYVFWAGACGVYQVEQLVLPIGQYDILPCLAVNHAWRKRAAGLFYRTAVVAIGTSDTVRTVRGACRVRTNIRLILESGYAPKTTRLAVLSIGTVLPDDLAECLLASEFAGFEWPGIDTLYFYHPQDYQAKPGGLEDQDEAIDDVNRYLQATMPNLVQIYALSGTSDSFGLFALDDLINDRLPYLSNLAVVAQGTLKLVFQGNAQLLKQLTMCTVASALLEPTDQFENEHGATSDDDSDIEPLLQIRSTPLEVPRVYAELLVSLVIGPIVPQNIWAPFFGTNEASGIPDLLAVPNFACLRRLRLIFGPLQTSRQDESRRKARHSNKQKASPGPGNTVVSGIYPQFPQLESLAVERYPYNILLFLENFPRSRLRHLELHKCPHHFFKLALSAFSSLETAVIEIPEAPHGSKEQDEENWIFHTFSDNVPTLRSLSLAAVSVFHQVDLPSKNYKLKLLQHLELSVGMRSVELEKLLVELTHLCSLRVVITDVLGKTHEYLSRSMRPKKYSKANYSHRVLSVSLEQLAIRLLDLTPSKRRRALAKTAWVAARTPSIMRIHVQEEYLNDLASSIAKVQANKQAPVDTRHLSNVKLQPLL